MNKVKITNIKWCIDLEDESLTPEQEYWKVCKECNLPEEVEYEVTDDELNDLEDVINDRLSDDYGFLTEDWMYEVL